jgi:predicted nucleotidyltransferase
MSDIQAVVDRITAAYDPERVVLFGSHARGAAAREAQADPGQSHFPC